MATALGRNWGWLVLRGVLAIIFALLAWLWPGLTLEVLVLFFGAYALVDGVFALGAAFQRLGRHERWGAMLVEGILGIVVGILTFVWPGVTALVLVTFIGVWAIITGVMEIWAAIQLRQEIANEWLLGIAGALSVIFGVLVLIFPGTGALSIVWLIGVYAFLFGLMLIALGWRLRGWHESHGPAAPQTT